MTIEFNCPNCGALIAFDSKHSGRQARCLTCGQKLIIPAESFQKPEKIAPEPEPKGDPIPGFFRAVFVDTWSVFGDKRNTTTLTFIAAVVCFRFFLARAVCCMNEISAVIIWGWLFGFYLNVIYQTAWEDDQLPEIYLGTSLTLLWYVFQPFIVFFYTLFIVELPFILMIWLTDYRIDSLSDIVGGGGVLGFVRQLLLITGLFLFPAAILATAVGKDVSYLRPDYLLPSAFQAFGPYITVALLLVATVFVQFHAKQHAGGFTVITALHLALNLLGQALAIFAMRSIGLFYRHYACHFKW